MNKLRSRILVLGCTGMLGNAIFRFFSNNPNFITFGSGRSNNTYKYFTNNLHERIYTGIDVENFDVLTNLFADAQPDIVINCIGVVKQLRQASDVLSSAPINTLLPHRLAKLSEVSHARFIHMSTDCVFSENKGNYVENDFSDAYDIYGRTKYLGEVSYPNSITLRTSIIGHELVGKRSLLNWFLDQPGPVNGFRRAIFSGLPTLEIAKIIQDYIIPNKNLSGVYHVSGDFINKFDLLCLLNCEYKKNIEIIPSDEISIDRSLNSEKFRKITGYAPPSWKELIRNMRNFG